MSERFEDEEIEGFLRQFEPRAPSALPQRPRQRQRSAWWAVAAAALVVGGVWIGLRRPAEVPPDVAAPVVTRPRATMGELSVLLRPPGGSTRVIEELERRVLADPRRSGGALRELARGGGGF